MRNPKLKVQSSKEIPMAKLQREESGIRFNASSCRSTRTWKASELTAEPQHGRATTGSNTEKTTETRTTQRGPAAELSVLFVRLWLKQMRPNLRGPRGLGRIAAQRVPARISAPFASLRLNEFDGHQARPTKSLGGISELGAFPLEFLLSFELWILNFSPT